MSSSRRPLMSLPPAIACWKAAFARMKVRSRSKYAVGTSTAPRLVPGSGGGGRPNLGGADGGRKVGVGRADALELSLVWERRDRNDSVRRCLVPAIGLVDVGLDATNAEGCAIGNGIICSTLNSPSSRNLGRPRFLCCTSTHVSYMIISSYSTTSSRMKLTCFPDAIHREHGRCTSQLRCAFLQFIHAEATCPLVLRPVRV